MPGIVGVEDYGVVGSVSEDTVVTDLPTPAQSPCSTLFELRSKVYMGLRDDDREFIREAMVDEFLNEGYIDLAARLRLRQAEATGTTTSTGTIPFPDGYQEMISLTIGDSTSGFANLGEVSNEVFDSWKNAGAVPGNVLLRLYGSNFETYPEQASVPYTLRFAKLVDRITIDDQKFTYLPCELEIRLVAYARSQCRFIEGDQADGDRYLGIYLSGLPDTPRVAQRWGKGPKTMTVAPSPFEV